MAWPILLMLSSLAWRSWPSSSNASSSKKHHTLPPLDRNSSLLDRSCSSVVKIVRCGARLPFVHELDRPLLQLGARARVDEPFDDEEPVAFEPFDLLAAQHVQIVRRV